CISFPIAGSRCRHTVLAHQRGLRWRFHLTSRLIQPSLALQKRRSLIGKLTVVIDGQELCRERGVIDRPVTPGSIIEHTQPVTGALRQLDVASDHGAEKLGAMVIPMSGGQTPRQVQLIQDFEPDIIMCTPSYMLNIADEFERQGLDPTKSSLKVGIFGAEPWGESMRVEVEKRCGIDAVDIYGLSEVIGPGVASECIETKDGPTIWEDHFYPEIINPQTGEPAPEGEMGELVFTSLTKEALPIIRYRTRDLTRLLPGTARAMRRMERITGRSDDMLIIRGVNVFPTQIEERVLQQPGLSPHYQLRVSRDGRLDVLTVLVERKPDAAATDDETIANALKKDIKDYVGVSAQIEVCNPGKVARSEGKAVRVIDERDK
ncbi:MAG: AMP-binding protein, partial [Proteobacteria bacterium]|nr:AMP-binding protein [Pseudomonadota bacterium]